MDDQSREISQRVDACLQSKSPFAELRQLLLLLKAEGMTQSDMLQLLDGHRARHEEDPDETIYNSILDAMDLVTGFCSPQAKIF